MRKEVVIRQKRLQRLDLRGKIVAAFILAVIIAIADRFATIAAGFVVAVMLVPLAGLDWRDLRRRLFAVNLFLAFFWVTLPLTAGGAPLALGPLPVSRGGVTQAALITLKANGILLLFTALVGSSSVVSMGHALQALGVPDKMVHLLLFTFRYIHVIEQEYRRLHNAMLIRGFQPKTDFHTYRSYAHLIGMLLVRSCIRAQRVYEAMLCRGFQGQFHCICHFGLAGRDAFFIFSMLLSACFLVYLEWLPRI